MITARDVAAVVLMGVCSSLLCHKTVRADDTPPPTQQPVDASAPKKLTVTVGKSLIIDSPLPIERLSMANGDLAEAVAVKPNEVLINGKQPGETSLIVWQKGGDRLLYDLTVRMSPLKLDAIRDQVGKEFPGSDINITYENDSAFVRGTVKDVTSADRVMAIVATLGKSVNLLRVNVPPVETQVLLRVRFANVDRSTSITLGTNWANGSFNQSLAVGTTGPISTDGAQTFTLADAVNIFLFRKDINLVAEIKALEAKGMLEMLAEPNVMAINGKPASFVAGGEFPFPMVQGGTAVGTVTLSWREYGVRLNFLPEVTPRGTIRLSVTPEVSSLDFTNAVTISGFTVPGLATRRVQTEVELEGGQSFVIAGLLNNTMTESLQKIPGIGDIPLLGKLFQSKTRSKNNSELLVIVTPEIVRPIPEGQPIPDLHRTVPFLTSNTDLPMRQPGIDKTGPVPVKPATDSLPVEELEQKLKMGQAAPAPSVPPYQLVPMLTNPVQPSANPGLPPGTVKQ